MQQYFDKQGLRNGNINTSLFLEKFEGTVMYAMNKTGRLLIKFEKNVETGTNELLVKSANYTRSCSIEDLCGCYDCDVKHLVFVANIGESNISITCNGRVNKISMIRSDQSNALKNYPPNTYIKNANEIFIWMCGNVQYKPGSDAPTFYVPKSELKGCIEYFYLNGESIKIDKKESNLIPSCKQHFNDLVCSRTNCSSGKIQINVADCFSFMADEKLCKRARELTLYTSSNYSYIRRLQNAVPVQISIKWQTLSHNNYCLLGVDFRDGSSMILFNDGTGNIIMQSINSVLPDNTPVIISKMVDKVTNVLSIWFTSYELVIRMALDRSIHTFTEKISLNPIIITFGYTAYSNKCVNFSGYLDFQYNPKQFSRYQKVPNVSNVLAESAHTRGWGICFAVFAILTVILMIAFAIYNSLFKLPVKFTSNQTSISSHNKQLFDNIINISMPIVQDDEYAAIQDRY